jgi:hypothetical protein
VELSPLESFAMKASKTRLVISRASHRHLIAIGNIIVNWAAVEDLLDNIIIQLFLMDRFLGRIIVAQLDYRDKRNMLLAFMESLADGVPLKGRLNGLLPKLHTAHGIRSIVAHSFWTKGRKPGSIKPMRFEARGSIKMSGHHHNEPNYTARSLTKEAEKIGILYGELNGLIDWAEVNARNIAAMRRSASTSNAASE